jgi:hypothetical protein
VLIGEMGPEEIQVVGNYSSIKTLHPKVSIGPLDYLFLERTYTDEKRDEKPLGMKTNIVARKHATGIRKSGQEGHVA